MLTEEIYNKAHNMARNFFKQKNCFLAEEALHRALIKCHEKNNWYKPYVMQVVFNECRNIFSRGWYGNTVEKKTEHIYLDDQRILNVDERKDSLFLADHKKSVESIMAYKQTLLYVYGKLSASHKKVITAYLIHEDVTEAATSIEMKRETFKTHMKCISYTIKEFSETGQIVNPYDYLTGKKAENERSA